MSIRYLPLSLDYCRPVSRGIQRGKSLKMIPKRYTKTA